MARYWHDAWQQRLFEAYITRTALPAMSRRDIPGTANPARGTRAKSFLWHLQCGRCVWCGCRMVGKRPATLEHLVPKALGGANGVYNIALACGPCNRRRGCACCFTATPSRH